MARFPCRSVGRLQRPCQAVDIVPTHPHPMRLIHHYPVSEGVSLTVRRLVRWHTNRAPLFPPGDAPGPLLAGWTWTTNGSGHVPLPRTRTRQGPNAGVVPMLRAPSAAERAS